MQLIKSKLPCILLHEGEKGKEKGGKRKWSKTTSSFMVFYKVLRNVLASGKTPKKL